jgi:hypothetical protein
MYFRGPSMVLQGYGNDLSREKQSGGGFGTTGASGLKLLVAYENTVTYQPRFDFYGIGERSVRKNIGIEMDKAIGRALRSAK